MAPVRVERVGPLNSAGFKPAKDCLCSQCEIASRTIEIQLTVPENDPFQFQFLNCTETGIVRVLDYLSLLSEPELGN
jgi:hypothetical protein